MKRSKKIPKNTQRRSALSFNDENASLDIDDVLQSNPWKDIDKFEQSEAGRIQNVLNEFSENYAKQQAQTGKKAMETSKQSKKRSLEKSTVKDATITKPRKTSKIAKSNIVKNKSEISANQMTSNMTDVIKCKEVSNTNDKAILELEMIMEKPSNVVTEENIIKSIATSDLLLNQPPKNIQNITNMLNKNLQTSTPKTKKLKVTTQTEKSIKKTEENYTKESIEQPKISEDIVNISSELKNKDSGIKKLKDNLDITVKSKNLAEILLNSGANKNRKSTYYNEYPLEMTQKIRDILHSWQEKLDELIKNKKPYEHDEVHNLSDSEKLKNKSWTIGKCKLSKSEAIKSKKAAPTHECMKCLMQDKKHLAILHKMCLQQQMETVFEARQRDFTANINPLHKETERDFKSSAEVEAYKKMEDSFKHFASLITKLIRNLEHVKKEFTKLLDMNDYYDKSPSDYYDKSENSYDSCNFCNYSTWSPLKGREFIYESDDDLPELEEINKDQLSKFMIKKTDPTQSGPSGIKKTLNFIENEIINRDIYNLINNLKPHIKLEDNEAKTSGDSEKDEKNDEDDTDDQNDKDVEGHDSDSDETNNSSIE